MDTHKVVPENL